MNRFLMFVFIAAGLWSLAVSADQADGWQIGPLARPSGTYPVITPNKDSLFRNPVDGKLVHWEALHTFNPAAIVRNGKICVLYRAEDDTGQMRIGMHTSRLGFAETTMASISLADPSLFSTPITIRRRTGNGRVAAKTHALWKAGTARTS